MQRGIIKRVKILNFQIHKELEVKFARGLNAIRGDSRKGKTTVLRAISWVLENDPSGFEFRHNPKITGTGNKELPKEELTSVLIEFEDGQTIIRERNEKDVNRYVVNGVELSGFKTSVPQEVSDIAFIPFYCIQKQHPSFSDNESYRWSNPYFLISDSPTEVARKINELTGLQIIDKATRKAESVVRYAKSMSEASEAKLEKYKEEIKELDWLNSAEERVKDWEGRSKRFESQKAAESRLEDLIDKLKEVLKEQVKYTLRCRSERVYSALESTISDYMTSHMSEMKLKRIIDGVVSNGEVVEKLKERVGIESELVAFDLKMEKSGELGSTQYSLFNLLEEIDNVRNKQAWYKEHKLKAERHIESLESSVLDYLVSKSKEDLLHSSISRLQRIQNLTKNIQLKISTEQAELDTIISDVKICPIFDIPINKERCGGK